MKKRNNTADLNIFGKRLKRSLKENKIRLKDLAVYLNYSEDQISNYCRGLNSPDIEILKKTVLFFREKGIDISLDYLCGLEEEKTHDLAFICQETGLSEEAVKTLKRDKKISSYKYFSSLIAYRSEDFFSPFRQILNSIDAAEKHYNKASFFKDKIRIYHDNPANYYLEDGIKTYPHGDEVLPDIEAKGINEDMFRLNIRDAARYFEKVISDIIKISD